MFKLSIETANAAFGEHFADCEAEVCRILRDLADKIERASCQQFEGKLRDANGNTCGEFAFSYEDADDFGAVEIPAAEPFDGEA